MTTKETREYLKKVFQLEQNIYTMEEGIKKLKVKASALAQPREVAKPEYKRAEEKSGLGCLLSMIFGGIPILLIIVLILPCFLSAYGLDYDVAFSIAIAGCVCVIIAFIIIGIINGKDVERDNEASKESTKLANQELEKEYQARLATEKLRMEKETWQREQLYHDIQLLEEQKSECEKVLEDLYSLNIIHSKYRNFVAIGMFYEYFDTEQCVTLGGHEGAYNKYESEVRLNLIISKLDDVITGLHNIKENQFLMYNAIKESQEQTEKIYQNSVENLQLINEQNAKLQKLNDNSSLLAYNTQRAAENTETLKYITLYKERLNGDMPYDILNSIK